MSAQSLIAEVFNVLLLISRVRYQSPTCTGVPGIRHKEVILPLPLVLYKLLVQVGGYFNGVLFCHFQHPNGCVVFLCVVSRKHQPRKAKGNYLSSIQLLKPLP